MDAPVPTQARLLARGPRSTPYHGPDANEEPATMMAKDQYLELINKDMPVYMMHPRLYHHFAEEVQYKDNSVPAP